MPRRGVHIAIAAVLHDVEGLTPNPLSLKEHSWLACDAHAGAGMRQSEKILEGLEGAQLLRMHVLACGKVKRGGGVCRWRCKLGRGNGGRS